MLNLRLFRAFKAQDVVFIKLIKVKMPTILCIKHFEHDTNFITSGGGGGGGGKRATI